MTDQNKNEKQSMPHEDEDEIKKVAKKKVIYIELDEEITSVYDRVKKLQSRDMYLVVPERAVLIQSIVNLKILQRKLHDIEKEIYIITTDPVGTKLALQAGIKVFDKIDDGSRVTREVLNPELRIQPIRASTNEYEELSPSRMPSKKISILDLMKNFKQTKRDFSWKTLWDIRHKYKDIMKKRKHLSMPGGPNRKALTTLVVISVTMLLIIFYVALPGATVYLTPESNVLEASANITLADAYLNSAELDTHPSHTLASYDVDTVVDVTITYDATGELFSGENASGTITLYNEADYEWSLVAFTRLQSPDGVIFRTQQFVTIPPATAAGPSTMDVSVLADEKDSDDSVIGDRGNLDSGTRFILPGLREVSQSLLYGENAAPLTGGKTVVTKYVIPEDFDAAYARVESELNAGAQEALQAEVDALNSEQGSDLVLLTGDFSFDTYDPDIYIPDVEGDQVPSFEVTGSMAISGVAYNYSELVNILRSELKLKKSPEKQLKSIDESSLYYEVFDIDRGAKKIKITASIKGVEEYVLDPEEESGARLIKKIKDHIAGKSIDEAEEYIQNLEEINTVDIKSWPVWAPTIPNVVENIKIKVVE
ncbi:hypothetical protein COW94_02710 [Candidatus Peregrinibacteria bacterium CG22_combo_CG10-13_8_21_14_all_44_10]|nr:MAG: hypothetical protein AUK45_00995 [Candidatus Peregrinibacteria bacterium CG2_30_44_17]PIP66240.1 MAG: hypothetical protein COW94_02710 [Candidatus Peregrinibacteria bacterium CG22_combo_CG10-13_8_21_14_all_44_10]PIS03598.1 MAG: hypothetical protein COT83_05290 [Candidatus Peregrinibacteria bacterium CG10_big_fil_rev_8_21_14_0_10_44_7]PJB89612.1 MAG: hypothetical protein CO082_00305 [Candidatus Peregrinibacteria bacterium CG_4_9_14_0_8_um_filter_44_15]